MKYDRDRHRRRSIRLKGYDYASPGAYFVTICVQGRECLLGDIADVKMRLNRFGQIADGFWGDVPGHFAHGDEKNIVVDAHVTMPNHIHAIIAIHDSPLPPESRRSGLENWCIDSAQRMLGMSQEMQAASSSYRLHETSRCGLVVPEVPQEGTLDTLGQR